ncbi:MAG: TetR/AcrR family transcriptional regulator [Nocardioidaceae bacterium]
MGTENSPRRGRPPRHNRAQLLEAAAEIVADRGYEGLRYLDVSQATGVAVASLRHYFPSVDGLRRDALKQQVRTEMLQVAVAVARLDDPWERIRTLIRLSIGVDPEPRRASWLVWLEYWRAAARDQELSRDSDKLERDWITMTQRCIESGVEAGLFVLDQPAYDAALELNMLIDGSGPTLAISYPSQQAAEEMMVRVERGVRRMLGMPPADEDEEDPGCVTPSSA